MANPGERGAGMRRRWTTTTMSVVEFGTHHEIYLIPHLSDMSDDEMKAVWLIGPDFDDFQRDIVRTVRAMRRGRVDGDSPTNPNPAFTIRGVEHLRSSAHLEQRKINKDCVTQAVLGEQERHRQARAAAGDGGGGAHAHGGGTEAALRSASERASRWARDYARSLGAEDAAFVEAQRMAEQRAAAAAASRSARASTRRRGEAGREGEGGAKGVSPVETSTSSSSQKAQQVSTEKPAASGQCLTGVLENALELSGSPPSTPDRTGTVTSSARAAAATPAPPSADDAGGASPPPPPTAVVHLETFETKVQSVSIRPPGSAKAGGGRDGGGSGPNHDPPSKSKTTTTGAEGVNVALFNRILSLKSEVVPPPSGAPSSSSARLRSRSLSPSSLPRGFHKVQDGGGGGGRPPNMAVASLRSMLNRQGAGSATP